MKLRSIFQIRIFLVSMIIFIAAKVSFGQQILLPPYITPELEIFRDSVIVQMDAKLPVWEIYYTLDGKEPGTNSIKYTGPFVIRVSTVVKVICASGDSVSPTRIKFYDKFTSGNLKLPFNRRYSKTKNYWRWIDLLGRNINGQNLIIGY